MTDVQSRATKRISPLRAKRRCEMSSLGWVRKSPHHALSLSFCALWGDFLTWPRPILVQSREIPHRLCIARDLLLFFIAFIFCPLWTLEKDMSRAWPSMSVLMTSLHFPFQSHQESAWWADQVDQQFIIVEGFRKSLFHGLFEYLPNTYLYSFVYFLGHKSCGMDLPEDQPLCCRLWTMEAMLWPVGSCGGMSSSTIGQ